MPEEIKTKKRQGDAAPSALARYGDAGVGKSATRTAQAGVGFSFSSPGLALLGLRRRNVGKTHAKQATG